MNRINNFDLIRLLAAAQVMIWHAAVQLDYFDPLYGFLRVLFHLPGVPIFFALSGFLLSYSAHQPTFQWKKYARNRLLRIYPALYVCTFLTWGAMWMYGSEVPVGDWVIWLVSQLTILQPYVPGSLKSFGVGHPNGSLWSIAVELQFYVAVPLVWWVIGSWKRASQNVALVLLGLCSIACRYAVEHFLPQESWSWKALTVSLPYHFYFFVFGMLVHANWATWRQYLENKFLVWAVLYGLYVLIGSEWLGWYQNPYDYHPAGLLANGLLVGAVFSAAFTGIHWSEKLLQGNDISYGLYIYHMPLINILVMNQAMGEARWIWVTVVATGILAWLSWRWVEKPFLRLK